jgi:single-strand DNA-binding protein
MADGLNRVLLVGNLGADPEIRLTQSGQAVLNLRLATTEAFLNKEKGWQERTDRHNVVVGGKRAEALAKLLRVGAHIAVEGGLRSSRYEDREGAERYKTEIHASNVVLLGGRPNDDSSDRDAAPREAFHQHGDGSRTRTSADESRGSKLGVGSADFDEIPF